MEKIVRFFPAYDKGREGGIHGVNLIFVLKGKLGAVNFTVFTHWYLEETRRRGLKPEFPQGVDISYHAHEPSYEGQFRSENCTWLDGKPCYCDGSSLNAEPIMEKLIEGGDKAIWDHLEKYYESRLGKLE